MKSTSPILDPTIHTMLRCCSKSGQEGSIDPVATVQGPKTAKDETNVQRTTQSDYSLDESVETVVVISQEDDDDDAATNVRKRQENRGCHQSSSSCTTAAAAETTTNKKPPTIHRNGITTMTGDDTTTSIDSFRQQLELGYVALESCTALVDGGVHHELPHNQWIHVAIHLESREPIHYNNFDAPCTICQLNLATRTAAADTNDPMLDIWLDEVDSFDGFESSVRHAPCQRARSDASLLLGLIRSCSACTTIVNCFVLFRESGTAALIVTLTFPHLLQGHPGERYILAAKRPRNSSKPLPPSLQLLLSIIQSDWTGLDAWMNMLKEQPIQESSCHVEDRRPIPSFFPSQISPEELYLRIQGSSANQCRDEPTLVIPRSALNESCLLQIPKEVILESIAPFLRARSLDALRCTCSFLHQTLKAVVPGMKLELYSHQVTSLAWMRERECRALTESDCLSVRKSTQSSCTQRYEADLHRSVTGGRTTLLRARPPTDQSTAANRAMIRIDQSSGREVHEADFTDIPRSVARGGLLCDDPGLGKTITVLSLILQTSGLQTSRTTSERQGKVTDDDVFNLYWRDQMTKEYRTPILNKLLNGLARRDNGGGVFPIRPLWRAIQNDVYSSNFATFVGDVM